MNEIDRLAEELGMTVERRIGGISGTPFVTVRLSGVLNDGLHYQDEEREVLAWMEGFKAGLGYVIPHRVGLPSEGSAPSFPEKDSVRVDAT